MKFSLCFDFSKGLDKSAYLFHVVANILKCDRINDGIKHL